MPIQRFCCPHCHAPVDPSRVEEARSPAGRMRICPECDEPVFVEPMPADEAAVVIEFPPDECVST